MVTRNSTTLVSQNIKDIPYHFISDLISIHQLIIYNHKHFVEYFYIIAFLYLSFTSLGTIDGLPKVSPRFWSLHQELKPLKSDLILRHRVDTTSFVGCFGSGSPWLCNCQCWECFRCLKTHASIQWPWPSQQRSNSLISPGRRSWPWKSFNSTMAARAYPSRKTTRQGPHWPLLSKLQLAPPTQIYLPTSNLPTLN